jgi:hypothetical protein
MRVGKGQHGTYLSLSIRITLCFATNRRVTDQVSGVVLGKGGFLWPRGSILQRSWGVLEWSRRRHSLEKAGEAVHSLFGLGKKGVVMTDK